MKIYISDATIKNPIFNDRDLIQAIRLVYIFLHIKKSKYDTGVGGTNILLALEH